MKDQNRYSDRDPVQIGLGVLDGCSDGFRQIATLRRADGLPEERAESLDAWEEAFRRLANQARRLMAAAHPPSAWERLRLESEAIQEAFRRFMRTQTFEGVIEQSAEPFDPGQIYDHAGQKAVHWRETVNGVRLHFVAAGRGEPLLLLHGAPKTSFYWHKLFPLLTDRFAVIAPDIRGFGDSDKPRSGYGMETIAEDLAQLMANLGCDAYYVHGEDWGAAFGYALAAKHPDRVKKLSFSEMLLPGLGLEDWSALTPKNVLSHHWFWHIVFFAVPDVPEFLITGKEREFWGKLMRDECQDPSAISEPLLDAVVRGSADPGGLRPIFDVYRSDFENVAFVRRHMQRKLPMPVIAIAGAYFMGADVHRVAGLVAERVTPETLDCGHCLALERPERLAGLLRRFMG
ncbi:Pimeloyl-ACP methyl ester carboxylesterase [Paenibacillus sp. UNC496MF]|uniref:alpha/beta fold hydrolase n=1 Tax=Paenibacillus sp. UNC496MF TaxID=1502753 RepID=UPI0008F374AD|nr:alpha/beta fold hydrolase [Paenibacillus sp. UNC496MF]SFJ42109.1 Pimeloyl-ACP methyl ester carboxylesterase [Paenibacillus sp. UNC496MF]